MRIISPFPDFCDGVQRMGTDRSLVYVRNPGEVAAREVPCFTERLDTERWRGRWPRVRIDAVTIGFCGRFHLRFAVVVEDDETWCDELPEAVERAVALAERLEILGRIVALVRKLEEPYRTAIQLRYLENLTPAEIAARTGEPAATVRSRIHRGLAIMREQLDRESGGRRTWKLCLLPLAGRAAAGGLLLSAKAKILVVAAAVLLAAIFSFRITVPSRAPEAPSDRSANAWNLAGETPAAVEAEPPPAAPPATASGPTSLEDLTETSVLPPGAEAADPEGRTAAAGKTSPPPAAGTVSGRVVLPDNGDMAGVSLTVVMTSPPPGWRPRDGGPRPRSVEVAPDGTFHVEGLRPGKYFLEARHPVLAAPGQPFAITAGVGAGPLEVVFRQAGSIVATVLGADELPRPGQLV